MSVEVTVCLLKLRNINSMLKSSPQNDKLDGNRIPVHRKAEGGTELPLSLLRSGIRHSSTAPGSAKVP
jgi:hypothetical protein